MRPSERIEPLLADEPVDDPYGAAPVATEKTRTGRSNGRKGRDGSSLADARRDARPPVKRKLSKNAVNFIVDACVLVSFGFVMWMASILAFVFPAASEASGWTLWGQDLDFWMAAAAGALTVFAVLVLIHLILHWSWVCSFITSRWSQYRGRRIVWSESYKTVYGVATLIVALTILCLAVAWAQFSVKGPPIPPSP